MAPVMDVTRRSFIKWVISAGAVMACPAPMAFAALSDKKGGGKGAIPAGRLESETNTVCHEVRDGMSLPLPAPSLKKDVVIVGGGPSGLGAADELKNENFLLIEKEPHLGGNAYSESWKGVPYSTGAAWDDTEGEPDFAALVKRWNLNWKEIPGNDAAHFNGVWISNFWNGHADNPAIDKLPYGESVKKSFRDFLKEIQDIDIDKNLKALDLKPFSDYFKGRAPELKAYWDGFGKSNWGAPTELSSSYLGIQAARDWFRVPRYTWAGGIGIGSKEVYAQLPEKAKKSILTGAAAYSVRKKGKKVLVSFFHEGKPHTVEAKSVVMCVPKFITRFLVQDLPEDQARAMGAMRYAPYLVYNLCFSRVVTNRGFDNWVPGAKNFTDFIPADWVTYADGGNLKRPQVVTVYAPLNQDQRESILTDAGAKARAKAAVEELLKISPEWLPHLEEVRIYRRGHPIPMSIPGYFTKLQPAARRDFPPIYFGCSDAKGEVSDFFFASLNGIAAAKKAAKHI
ncbi:MAG TPA: FAD-dependent oxidoreductase [Elusimicrobiota bacterium]|nr:FAD-dependent oxidoreductase [Elusimicrobiota bacterium]